MKGFARELVLKQGNLETPNLVKGTGDFLVFDAQDWEIYRKVGFGVIFGRAVRKWRHGVLTSCQNKPVGM